MVLLIFMLMLFVGALIHKDVRSHLRHSLRPGGERAHARSNNVDNGCSDDHARAWTALDDLQLARLLKDSAT
jgi:hypothetical protein